MKGFTESGDELAFAVGSVTGVRWWRISEAWMQWSLQSRLPELEPPPDVPRLPVWQPLVPGGLFQHGRLISPAVARPPKPSTRGMLTGANSGLWAPGENLAECRGVLSFISEGARHEAPARNCKCGFWAYWDLADAPPGSWDVAGVIQGYGRATIGPLGFRCQKAKIIALCLETRIQGCNARGEPVTDQSSAEEWRLDMEDLLRDTYGATMWSSLDAMAAAYPPNPDYATPEILERARARQARIQAANAATNKSLQALRNADDDKNNPRPDGAG